MNLYSLCPELYILILLQFGTYKFYPYPSGLLYNTNYPGASDITLYEHEHRITWNHQELILKPWQTKTIPNMHIYISYGCVIIIVFNIPSAQQSCWGLYWFHSVRMSARLSIRPSIRPVFRFRSVAPTVLDPFHIFYILSSNLRRCVTC